jgi:hypothetical protein
MQYNTNFECTYHTIASNKDDENDPECNDYSDIEEADTQYRREMLIGLNMSIDDMNKADELNKRMDWLYSQLKNETTLEPILTKAAGSLMSTDKEIGMTVLFSYDTFHLFHKWLTLHLNSSSSTSSTFSSSNTNEEVERRRKEKQDILDAIDKILS